RRARLAAEGRERGWAALHRRLAGVDAESAARIHPNDPQRIQRALEVYELTGEPMSRLLAGARAGAYRGAVARMIIEPGDRAALHRDIEARFRAMLARGLVEEVRALLDDPRVGVDAPAMRAVGYRQVCDHLAGRTGRGAMTTRAVVATRQLARRQLTWLRAERDATRLDSQDARLAARAHAALARTLGL
ncbi:MAG: tRNA dimethylallyltransferase, partial [Gammaproteobacteria bacterium]|nr:tRNA dimethylallyltransferase [Gammaproteobacteria bacterium]